MVAVIQRLGFEVVNLATGVRIPSVTPMKAMPIDLFGWQRLGLLLGILGAVVALCLGYDVYL